MKGRYIHIYRERELTKNPKVSGRLPYFAVELPGIASVSNDRPSAYWLF